MNTSGACRAIVSYKPHAAARFVDAPALPDDVAGPADLQGPRRPGRRVKTTGRLRTEQAWTREVVEPDAVEDRLARRQPAEVDLRGEVCVFERGGSLDDARGGEALVAGHFHEHARGTIRAAPDHRSGAGDVADLHAARHRRRVCVLQDAAHHGRRKQRRGRAKEGAAVHGGDLNCRLQIADCRLGITQIRSRLRRGRSRRPGSALRRAVRAGWCRPWTCSASRRRR